MKKQFILLSFCLQSMYLLAQSLPAQPCIGPSGQKYQNGDPVISQYGTTVNDWFWLIEPANPTPNSAEVIVFWHGKTDIPISDAASIFRGDSLFVNHLAKMGYIVIYPLYQHLNDGIGGVRDRVPVACSVLELAITELLTNPHVTTRSIQPGEKMKLGAIGGSLGGGIALRVANEHQNYNFPSFDAICSFNPGPVRDVSNLDPGVFVLVVSSEEDDLNGPQATVNNHAVTWQTVLNQTTIDCANKNYILAKSDYNGSPPLVADHVFGASGNDRCNETVLNALDYYGSWKWATALFNCRFRDYHCKYCLGNFDKITNMGELGNNQDVVESEVLHSCP